MTLTGLRSFGSIARAYTLFDAPWVLLHSAGNRRTIGVAQLAVAMTERWRLNQMAKPWGGQSRKNSRDRPAAGIGDQTGLTGTVHACVRYPVN